MTQIKLRRDTAANFTSKNPVLGLGEPAYETDTKKLKIGDGTTAYTQLEYFSASGGGSTNISATLPLKIVDGVISLEVDGQTIQIVGGKLHANLDELENEVNSLTGRVTATEADLANKASKSDLDKKENKITATAPLSLKEKQQGALTLEWQNENKEPLNPVPETINTPSVGVTNVYYPFGQQLVGNSGDKLIIEWENIEPFEYASATGCSIIFQSNTGTIEFNFDGKYKTEAASNVTIVSTINGESRMNSGKLRMGTPSGKTRWTFVFDRVTFDWTLSRIDSVSGVSYGQHTGKASGDILPTNSIVQINMGNANGRKDSYRIYTNSFSVTTGIDRLNILELGIGSGLAITDGKLTATGSTAPENMVTTDTAQDITGSKTFKGTVTLKSAEKGNQVSALQVPLYTSNTNLTFAPIVQSFTDLDNPVSELRFGSIDNKLEIRGSEVVDKNNKKFLTQGNITGTGNITVTETAGGIQISTTAIDGDWTYKPLALADSFSLPVNTEGAGGVFTYDLSNYLPNDGYKYEVTISVEVNNSNFCTLGYYLPDNTWYSFAKGGNPVGGWFNAIVDSSRQVKISVVNTQEALMWAGAKAYRRLGKKV